MNEMRQETHDDCGVLPCPHCGYMIGDLWDYDLQDEREAIAWCPSCNEEIGITMSVNVSYRARRAGRD